MKKLIFAVVPCLILGSLALGQGYSAGGSSTAPTNMATTDTSQTITGAKALTGGLNVQGTPPTNATGGVSLGKVSGFAGIWSGASVAAGPSTANYFLLDTGDINVNAPSNQSIFFKINNAAKGGLDLGGLFFYTVQAVTVADNGGGTAAASTLTPSTSYVTETCSDADGCDITISETGARDGSVFRVVNVGTNAVNFADTSGVSETAGALVLGQWDTVSFMYITDRWVQIAPVGNN